MDRSFSYRAGPRPRGPLAAHVAPRPRPRPSGAGALSPYSARGLDPKASSRSPRRILALSLALLALGLTLATAWACASEESQSEKASLSLAVAEGGKALARGFLPPNLAVTTISVSGKGPSGLAASAEGPVPEAGRGFDFELVPGPWAFSASGYNKDRIEIAAGLLDLSLAPGEKAKGDILLLPLQGAGSLCLSWTTNATLAQPLEVSGSLKPTSGTAAGTATPIQAAFTASPLLLNGLVAGRYELELRFISAGVEVCGLADSILIAAGLETRAQVAFEPPAARLCLGATLPAFGAGSLDLAPARRRVARGQATSFRASSPGPLSWYLEGRPLTGTAALLDLGGFAAPGQRHVDCLGPGLPGNRGRALLDVGEAAVLGPLAWIESIVRDDEAAASPSYAKGLGDCRAVAWSGDGTLLAAAGRGSNSISLLEAARAGSSFVASSLGGTGEPRLLAPSNLAGLPDGSLLATSDSEGAAYLLGTAGKALTLVASLKDPLLAGAADLALAQNGTQAYIAAPGTNSIVLLGIAAGLGIAAPATVAAKDTGSLVNFSLPSCLAIDPQGSVVATGTKGDDSIYLFTRSTPGGSLTFSSRLDPGAFTSLGSLSDPCSLVFSPDGMNLYVLSYYGKTVFRLGKDPSSGLFTPVAAAKSGVAAVQGFASPKRLALSPDGRLLAIVGSGLSDGLALFDVSAPGSLAYLGALLPGQGEALPAKPAALAFSPDGRSLALAGDGRLSMFSVTPKP